MSEAPLYSGWCPLCEVEARHYRSLLGDGMHVANCVNLTDN